ncbi:MAG: hypothetical protein EHM48_04780 [Planctomycetaceae bacterium]|nr:MAG: hypothetical protein EHM48_04780 [Planctomycetaceae bacterium]
MKTRNKRAVAIIMVLMILTVIGMAMLVLTAGTNAMLTDSQVSQIDACRRNMTASAAAWLRHNRGQVPPATLAAGVELNIKDMHIPQGSLKVARPSVATGKNALQVTTIFHIGRQNVNSTETLSLD